MRNVVEIHTEPQGSNNLEEITKLKWRETSKPGERNGGNPQIDTRAEMYTFVKNNKNQAYAISTNSDQYAYLEAKDNGHVQYVKTEPDGTKSDNLLSLPRF